jgi:hypothetical protein
MSSWPSPKHSLGLSILPKIASILLAHANRKTDGGLYQEVFADKLLAPLGIMFARMLSQLI